MLEEQKKKFVLLYSTILQLFLCCEDETLAINRKHGHTVLSRLEKGPKRVSENGRRTCTKKNTKSNVEQNQVFLF